MYNTYMNTTCERCDCQTNENDTRISKTGEIQWICPKCQAKENA